MRDAQPKTIFLSEYRAPDYRILKTDLHFELFDDCAVVHAQLEFERVTRDAAQLPLELDGEELELLSLSLNGTPLDSSDYELNDEGLRVMNVPATGTLSSSVRIVPQENTSLEGLYRSRGLFCTQCEAEGFRKITFFPDRPDIMSTYRVTIDGDRQQCPELLSNGNLIEHRELGDGRHRAVWEDPFPKPSYLFALVAGNLCRVQDGFTTASGRAVKLIILVEEKDLDKCDHAMESLKRAMRWDEERFGREYDLDVFHVVAVDDFNMGAMENKSLNIFNTSCVLASPATTTDAGYQRIESIVAHEYFHNWSGNRVTCRDWFQLSLKEGFTVFRDAEFSADMGSRALKRIEDVAVVRTQQFAEDAGPMSHPVRPESFIEISNFYTLTVYEKGAELVRMIQTLIGTDAFRRGSDLYFERHDGQAVTCDDFVAAMQDASGIDLSDFQRWYGQAGTPEVKVDESWDEAEGVYTLTVAQSTPATQGQEHKQPLVIPIAMGLLGEAGNLRIELEGENPDLDSSDNTHRVLIVDKEEQTFRFTGLPEQPVPSLLRGFSAPVRLHYPYSREQLVALASRDDDDFVRWDAMQQLMIAALQDQQSTDRGAELDPLVKRAFKAAIDQDGDPAMRAELMRLPSESSLAELASRAGSVDVHAIHAAREGLRQVLAKELQSEWAALFDAQHVTEAYVADAGQIGRRALANLALDYAAASGTAGLETALAHYAEADNLTNRLVALQLVLREAGQDKAQELLDDFYTRFGDEALALNHWLLVQAQSPSSDPVARVRSLMQHPAYDPGNPNKIRSLIGGFANGNPTAFHRHDGEGYRFLGTVIEDLNDRNPQIASRLLTPLTRWRNYPCTAPLDGGSQMRSELERLAGLSSLSRDVYEVVSKSLG